VTHAAAEYDRFAEIYAVWTDTAASTRANLAFYLDAYARADGPVVELGVGDGRIAVPAAQAGQPIIGVDLSKTMLALCRRRADEAGVGERLTLLQADFSGFQLDAPAALVALPYHSIGHLLTLDDKRRAMAHVFSQLRPGGRFIFDDFLMTPDLLAHMQQVQLRAEYRSAAGADMLLWVTSLIDRPAQSMRVVTWEDELDSDGRLVDRRYRRLSLSWLTPSQARDLLADVGFLVEACYGDFDGTPFSPDTAREHVWVARRPLHPV
jgi:SAM-dependent methyltransferase